MNLLRGRRFKRAAQHVRDGRATPQEVELFEKSISEEPALLAFEQSMDEAMGFLRSGTLDVDATDDFEGRTIRRWKLESRKRTVSYWVPTLVGAGAAAAGLLAVLQLLLSGPEVPRVFLGNQEAKLERPAEDPAFSTFRDSTINPSR